MINVFLPRCDYWKDFSPCLTWQIPEGALQVRREDTDMAIVRILPESHCTTWFSGKFPRQASPGSYNGPRL